MHDGSHSDVRADIKIYYIKTIIVLYNMSHILCGTLGGPFFMLTVMNFFLNVQSDLFSLVAVYNN